MTEPTEAPRFVVKILTYADSFERVLQHRCVIEGESPAGFCLFFGQGIALIPNVDDPTKQVTKRDRFDIPGATTYQEAFDLYDTFWQRRLVQLNAVGSQPKPRATFFVVRVDELLDNTERNVQEHVLVEGELPPKYPRFHGRADFRLPNGAVLTDTFILDGAETVAQAYDLYGPIVAEIDRRTGIQFMQAVKAEEERIKKELHERDMAVLKEARARQAEGGKKLILPTSVDKRGKHGPLGAKKAITE